MCVSIVIRNNNITARNYNDNKYWPPLTLTPHPRHSRPRPRWRGAGGVPHGLLPPDLGPQPPGDLLLLCPHPIPPVHRSSDLSRSVTSHPPSSGLGSHHPALNVPYILIACCLFPQLGPDQWSHPLHCSPGSLLRWSVELEPVKSVWWRRIECVIKLRDPAKDSLRASLQPTIFIAH